MNLHIRSADGGDASDIVGLIEEMAEGTSDAGKLTPDYVGEYLQTPGCGVLVAESDGGIIGMLSYVVRPDLYHAAVTLYIQEMMVTARRRKEGIGGLLLDEVMRRARALSCAEVSEAVVPDNAGAVRLYRSHGIDEQNILLEKHFQDFRPSMGDAIYR